MSTVKNQDLSVDFAQAMTVHSWSYSYLGPGNNCDNERHAFKSLDNFKGDRGLKDPGWPYLEVTINKQSQVIQGILCWSHREEGTEVIGKEITTDPVLLQQLFDQVKDKSNYPK